MAEVNMHHEPEEKPEETPPEIPTHPIETPEGVLESGVSGDPHKHPASEQLAG